MDTKKLEQLIKDQYGSVLHFCHETGVVYTTLKSSMETPEKLANMKYSNFRAIAHALNMTSDDLYDLLVIER